jgi:hypothetical protein
MAPSPRYPIFSLLASWRTSPTGNGACALCDALRARPALAVSVVSGVASELLARHAEEQEVLIALARLMLATDHYEDSIDILVAAGRLDPSARAPYRLLGEALLRRGDAIRAERLFVHAVSTPRRAEADDDADGWLRLAKILQKTQAVRGEEGVAEEMTRRMPPPLDVQLIGDEPAELASVDEDESTARIPSMRPDPEDITTRTVHAIDDAASDESVDEERTAKQRIVFDASAAALALEGQIDVEIDIDDQDFPTNVMRAGRRDTLDTQLDDLFEKSTIGPRPGR